MKRVLTGLGVAAMVAYPLMAHGAAIWRSAALALGAAALLLVLMLGPALRRGRLLAWLVLVPSLAGLVWLGRHDLGLLPLYAPPVLLNGLFAWAFARSLQHGRVPLIERARRVIGVDLGGSEAEAQHYTRRLTWQWAMLLGGLAVLNLGLALLAAPRGLLLVSGITPPLTVRQSTWSLFANLLNYLIIGGFFVFEQLWRRLRHPPRDRRSVLELGSRVMRLGPAFWRQK